VAAREDQAEPVVGEWHVRISLPIRGAAGGVAGTRRIDAGEVRLDRGVARQLLGLVLEPAATAQSVDGSVASGRGDPRARVVRHPARRPGLQRRDERLLNGFLGEIEVTKDADERRDRPARLGAEQAVDDLVRGWLGRRQWAPAACTVAGSAMVLKSTMGRTSIEPRFAPGIIAA
jgi:hypothetical protein